ncbi:hypothetical protein [Nocardioides sp. AN3]
MAPIALGAVAVGIGAWIGASALAGAVVFALVLLFNVPRTYARIRRRTLTVTKAGLDVQRDQYRLHIPWSGVTAVARRRHQLVWKVEELIIGGAEVVALGANGEPTNPPEGLHGHAATTRILLSLYSPNWREEPIGECLRQLGIAGAS